MQRRAAAVYAAFFVLVAAASYGMIATAESPEVTLENAQYELSQGDEFTVGGQSYTVSSIDASLQGGGHGSAASLVRSGEVQWTNESARYTRTWENGSTITYDGEEWAVGVPNASGRTELRLVEAIDRQAILRNDTAADNETITRDGQEFVVVTEADSDTSRLVPADDYFSDPAVRTFAEGDTVPLGGNETTLATVDADGGTLEWFAPRTTTASVGDASNVTLSGETYFAMYPDNSTLLLAPNADEYRDERARIDTFNRHKNGLWGVTAVGLGTAILLIGLAYMPSRY
jgi:hypothetical protein